MYTLLSGLYTQWTRKEEFNVVILGLDNAGKTTLLERIKATYTTGRTLSPDQIGPTIGLNIGKIELNSVRLNFWDLGGQRDLLSIWSKYYSECHGIIFVIDATDESRIQDVKVAFENVITSDLTEGIPVLMLANKSDKPGALTVANVKEVFNQIALKLGARDSKVMAVSALRGEGVRDAIDWLWVRLDRNRVNRPPVIKEQ
ncbi:ADP-ribosylation factor family-domain-containing protein [Chytridium lagenaria]|nr:ADP-ribosylation factor family-domain-containing protein [Chytridium lagenaria]